MVWNQIMARLRASNRRSINSRRQRLLRFERMERREVLASNIGAIAGVAFIDLAGDGSAAGDPPVLVDNSGNLVAPGTAGAQGIQVRLYDDTNNNNVFDGADQLLATRTTDLSGRYRFDSLSPGVYFVQQQSVPQLNTPGVALVTVNNDGGVRTVLIDDYSLTTQSVTAISGSNGSNSALASEAIGGERDILVSNTATTGQLTVFVDNASDTLSIGSLGDAVGTALIQYDGPDGTTVLSPTGLGGVSLAGGSSSSTLENNSGLVVLTRAENAGDSLFITIYTDGANSSTTTIPLPQNDANFIETFVLFSDFVTATGNGANFNNVGSIEASIALSANNDVFVSIIEARRPDAVQTNLINILPVALGGVVFRDNSSGGQNNGLLDNGEQGFPAVRVDLYEMDGPSDIVNPSVDVAIASTTTGADGSYLFGDLNPGNYAVAIQSSQFATGATLFGWANSTGNDPPPNPNLNINNVDQGFTIAGGAVITGTITLVSNSEPTNDGDQDPNTNTTMDLGFFPKIDLSITKTLNGANSNLVAGGTAAFDFVVQNLGPLTATNVTVRDVFPTGLTFNGIANQSGSFTVSVNGATVDVLIGSLAAGATATFRLNTTIAGSQSLDVTNTATVSGAEVDIDLSNNTDSATLDLPTSDLRIVKTGSINPVIAGNQLTYQIQVTNAGPDPASGVVVTDQLPGEVTFVSGNVGGNSSLVINNGSGQITANVGTLDANESATVTVVVSVKPNANGPLSNTANVTATPNNDPNPSNNSASESTQVARSVDVGILKSIVGAPVAGGRITYQVNVNNNGPSEARGVVVTDALAEILSFVPGSFNPGTSGVTLVQDGQNLTFNVGLLSPGETETFRFDVLIDPSAQGNVSNTAIISTTDPDSDTSNNTGLVSVPVQRQVDLILSKTVDKSVAVPGRDMITYTFVVSHATGSISDASGVMVTDLIPTGLVGTVINAPTANSTDFSNGVVTVGFNSIPLGESRTFTVTASVQQAATGTITNSGSVASAGTELNPGNNTDTASVTLDPDFDVVVTKTVDDDTPNPTQTVTYTVALNNLGPSSAPGVVLSDSVPTGLTFVSGTLQGQAATVNGNMISFPAISIASGVTANATLIFTVNGNASGTITNTARIPDLSDVGERDVTNNSDTVDINVVALANLSIAKSVSLTEAVVGSNLTYTITVNNSGPSTANMVQVVDTLPAGVSFVSGTGPNGEALSAVNGVVTVNAGNLTSAGSFQITINGKITSAATGNQVNSATVSSATPDSNAGNNTSTATTQLDPSSSTFSGLVFHDRNNNGALDPGEVGIPGVLLTMTGNNFLGTAVNFTVTTNANGEYQFANLARGTYRVTQTQPEDFRDGVTILGTGASAVALDNVFSQIALGRDVDAINFLFAERSLPLSKRRFLAST